MCVQTLQEERKACDQGQKCDMVGFEEIAGEAVVMCCLAVARVLL